MAHLATDGLLGRCGDVLVEVQASQSGRGGRRADQSALPS